MVVLVWFYNYCCVSDNFLGGYLCASIKENKTPMLGMMCNLKDVAAWVSSCWMERSQEGLCFHLKPLLSACSSTKASSPVFLSSLDFCCADLVWRRPACRRSEKTGDGEECELLQLLGPIPQGCRAGHGPAEHWVTGLLWKQSLSNLP